MLSQSFSELWWDDLNFKGKFHLLNCLISILLLPQIQFNYFNIIWYYMIILSKDRIKKKKKTAEEKSNQLFFVLQIMSMSPKRRPLLFCGWQRQKQKIGDWKTALHNSHLPSLCVKVTSRPALSASEQSEEYAEEPKYWIKMFQGLNLYIFHSFSLSSHHLKLAWTPSGFLSPLFFTP